MKPTSYYGNLTKDAFEALSPVLKRFLNYTQYKTAANPKSTTVPSSIEQLAFAQVLRREFEAIGMSRVEVARSGIVMAWLEATAGCEALPAIGFITHMDTSPSASGEPARWRLIDYQGGDIVLNDAIGVVTEAARFPELARYVGEPIVVTDGTTLLGADDKAGIAVMMEVARYFVEHPEVPHAKLCFAITCDEEISRGTANFDIEAFGADYAYTIDGSEKGCFDTETFNAAQAFVHFEGLNVHPGSAKNKMINAIRLAMDFIDRFPKESVPEKTQDYEGFFHPSDFNATVRSADVRMLIRDHDTSRFNDRLAYMQKVVDEMNANHPGAVTIRIEHQYSNMKDTLQKTPLVCDIARRAFARAGVEIIERPVRGGTDGARLTARGLPCPNIFAGGMNFHGVYEYLPVTSLESSLAVVKALAELSAEVQTLD